MAWPQRLFSDDWGGAATEIEVSSSDDDSPKRRASLPPALSIAEPLQFEATALHDPVGANSDPGGFATKGGGLHARSPRMSEDAEDLPLSMLVPDGVPTPLRISAATVKSSSSDIADATENLPVTQSPRPKPVKALPRASPKASPKANTPKASPKRRQRPPGSPGPSESSASKVICQRAEIRSPKGCLRPAPPSTPGRSARSSEPASPPLRRGGSPGQVASQGSRSPKTPAPKAKAEAQNKRKTLAQRLQDRQRKARTAEKKAEDPAAKKASKAAAYKSKVEKTEQLMADAIRSDRELYEKLLIFEVMEIEEVAERLQKASEDLRTVGRKRIREFLEGQGFVLTQQKKMPREVYQKARFQGGRRN